MKCPMCGELATLTYHDTTARAEVRLDCPSCHMAGIVATSDPSSFGSQITAEALQQMVRDHNERQVA